MKHSLTIFIFLFLLFSFSSNGFAGNIKTNEPQNTIKFTENKNQWDNNILYRAQLDGGSLFLEKNCFTYNFYDKETVRESHMGKERPEAPPGLPPSTNAQDKRGEENPRTSQTNVLLGSSSSPSGRSGGASIRTHAFRMTFLNAKKNS